MDIPRDKYVNALLERRQNGLIKVISGIRRSGKSYLLFHLFKNRLLEEGVQPDHILSLELDRRENRAFRDPDLILDYLKSKIEDHKLYYVFLDEVQLLEDFEEVLNSLLHLDNVDVYVTGSNSKFLSRDIVSEFRGRSDDIHLLPLNFQEFMQQYPGQREEAWEDYYNYGGLPLLLSLQTDEQKENYLRQLFQTTYLRDIQERYHIEKAGELAELVKVLASAIGALSNPSRIHRTFQSVSRSDISLVTLQQYIDYLEDAFVIKKVQRYDVKGRKYIGTPYKYYFEDLGLRNACLDFRQVEESHLMENILFNELRSRGFHLDVGQVPFREPGEEGKRERRQLEIDFVANKGSQRYYIQSALTVADEAKLQQEKASLQKVGDSFKKVIICKDVRKIKRDDAGIVTLGLFDFLLHEDSLNW